MNKEPLWNRPTVDEIAKGDRILVAQGGAGKWSTPDQIKAYMGTSEDTAELGVPIPTAADAGKALTVKASNAGFEFLPLSCAELLWKNEAQTETERFDAQRIDSDNAAYSLFIVVFKYEAAFYAADCRYKATIVPKDASVSLHNTKVLPDMVEIVQRNIRVDNFGFDFERCNVFAFYRDKEDFYGHNNRMLIPIAIYGLRQERTKA